MTHDPKAPGAAESAPDLYATLTEQLRASAELLEYTGPESIPVMRAKLAHQSWMLDRLFGLALDDSICKDYIDEQKARVALQTQNQYRHTVLTLEALRNSANKLLESRINQDSGLRPHARRTGFRFSFRASAKQGAGVMSLSSSPPRRHHPFSFHRHPPRKRRISTPKKNLYVLIQGYSAFAEYDNKKKAEYDAP